MRDLAGQLNELLHGRYAVEREIGRGGMAIVFLARDLKHNRPVALKVLNPEVSSSIGEERFLREIQIAARLSHPYILSLHDSGGSDGILYYVMPYVEGESLRDRLARERQLPVNEAIGIARQVADALEYAHRLGVVHRDIKPENILLQERQALVADFGVAYAVNAAAEGRLTATGVSVGTLAYMSPEQLAADPETDARADIYSLGCVLYEMLAGELPFQGMSAAGMLARKATQAPAPLRAMRDTVPESVERAVMRALAKSPADRFATAGEFAESLAVVSRPVRARFRRRTVAIAVAVFVFVTAGVAWVVSGGVSVSGPAAATATRLAVLPFAFHGRESPSPMADGMVHLLSRNLDGLLSMQTADPSTVITIVKRSGGGLIDTARARTIAKRLGARLYVLGSIHVVGSRLRILATLFDESSGAPQGAQATVEGDTTELFQLADRLTAAIVAQRPRSAGARLAGTAATTTQSLAALKEYLEAEEHLRDARFDSALAGYRRAVAADSTFALAHYRMAVAAGLSFRWSIALEPAERALSFAERLGERDRRLLNAYHAFLLGRADDAERQYTSILSEYPDDLEARFLLGRTLYYFNPRRGRPIGEARRVFYQVLETDPSFLCPI